MQRLKPNHFNVHEDTITQFSSHVIIITVLKKNKHQKGEIKVMEIYPLSDHVVSDHCCSKAIQSLHKSFNEYGSIT